MGGSSIRFFDPEGDEDSTGGHDLPQGLDHFSNAGG